MKEIMKIFKIFCVFIIVVPHLLWCREFEECRDIRVSDIVVASKKSCAKYIFCDRDNSYEGECLAGNYFNEKSGSCDNRKNVKCNIQPNDDVKSIYDEDFAHKENDQENREEEQEKTEDGEKDDNESLIEEIEEYDLEESEINDDNVATATHHNEPKCPPINGFPNIKHIANPESCVAFYTCYNGHAIPMLCPGKMYFNEENGKCEPQMPESCKSRQYLRLNCHKGVYDYVPHPYRCEYYFYCLNGYLMIMRCPYDFTWHYERGTCVHKSRSKCYFEKSVIYRHDNLK